MYYTEILVLVLLVVVLCFDEMSGYCVPGLKSCYKQNCCPPYSCLGDYCVSCGKPGDFCEKNSDCCSQICSGEACQSCLAYGTIVKNPGDCCSGRSSAPRGKPQRCYCTHVIGHRCTVSRDCCSELTCQPYSSSIMGVMQYQCRQPSG